MKKLNLTLIIIIHLIICFPSEVIAQQDPLFTQFWNTKNFLNPATAGLNFKHEANVLARWQWIGVNGAPDSQLASYSMKLNKHRGGIGVNYMHDKIGFNESNTAKLTYAYHLIFENENILSFGLASGIKHFKLTPFWVTPTTAPDPILIPGYSDVQFTSDFGIAYRIKEKANLGLSVSNLNQPRFSGKDGQSYQDSRIYYLFADYIFGKEDGFQIKPQVLIRTDLIVSATDFNTTFIYNSRYSIGLTYRPNDSYAIIACWDIKQKFRLAYSYDYTVSKLSNISRGSHEIALGLRLK